jgi:hypothetical protein
MIFFKVEIVNAVKTIVEELKRKSLLSATFLQSKNGLNA